MDARVAMTMRHFSRRLYCYARDPKSRSLVIHSDMQSCVASSTPFASDFAAIDHQILQPNGKLDFVRISHSYLDVLERCEDILGHFGGPELRAARLRRSFLLQQSGAFRKESDLLKLVCKENPTSELYLRAWIVSTAQSREDFSQPTIMQSVETMLTNKHWKNLCLKAILKCRLKEKISEDLIQLEDLANCEVGDSEAKGYLMFYAGDMSANVGDLESAKTFYEKSIQCFEGSINYVGASAAKIRLASTLAQLGNFMAGKSQEIVGKLIGEAIKLGEEKYEYINLSSALCLSSAGQIFHRYGDAIISEGLFRKAESRFQQLLEIENSSIVMLEYASCINKYSNLLEGLQWNGRPRGLEGQAKSDNLKMIIRKQFPKLIEVNPNLEKIFDFWEIEFLTN